MTSPKLPTPAHCDVEVADAVGDYKFYTAEQMLSMYRQGMERAAEIALSRSLILPRSEIGLTINGVLNDAAAAIRSEASNSK